MRLVKLRVKNFGCVDDATVEFGPGLNVLYGPNDLGKSSLAEAIRCALLLPHGSSHAEMFVPWRQDATPEVDLVFATEPGKYWRIRKTFGRGSRGSSVFEFSKDGVSFSSDAKGRDVDGKIREHLRWGIPEPGGKSAPRGMPESFLTTVLFSRQDSVAELFGRHLDEDGSDSGKKLLTEALHAVAQDPLFLRVLEQAQDKVDEAFTPTGGFRRGKGAPFARMRDQLTQAEEEYQGLVRQVTESESARDRLRELSEQLVFEEDELQQARVALAQIDAILAVEAQVQKARAEVERVEALWVAVNQMVAERERLAADVSRADAALRACDAEVSRVTAEVTAVQQEIERLERGDDAQQRLVRKGALEKKLAELDGEREKLTGQRQRACALRELEERVVRFERERGELAEKAAALRAQMADVDVQLADVRATHSSWKGIRLWVDRKEYLERLEGMTARSRQRAELQARAGELDQRAAGLQAEIEGTDVPARADLDAVRALERTMQIAEAALDVGLAADVAALSSIQLLRHEPSGDPVSIAGGQVVSIEGGRQIRFSIPGVVEITLHGGRSDARIAADRARAAYETAAAPLLRRANASCLADIDPLIEAASSQRQEVTRLRAEADAAREQARALVSADTDPTTLEARLAECERQLADYPREILEEKAKNLGPAHVTALETEIARCEASLRRLTTQQTGLEAEIAAADARGQSTASALAEATQTRENAQRDLAGPWQPLLQECERRLTALGSEREQAAQELAGLDASGDHSLMEARDRLTQLAADLQSGEDHRLAADDKLKTLQQQLFERSGEVKARNDAAEREDLVAKSAAMNALIAQRDGLPRPAGIPQPDARDRERAARRVTDVEAHLRDLKAQLHAAEGALAQVGGDVVRERCQAASGALEKYRALQRHLEVEYNAWRLLLETLKEAERDQATHLGQSLVSPIAEHFAQVAGSRYGTLDLGPALQTTGIHAAGESRELSLLSCGTREQLSTIFRLSLAEQLKSAILLDDQLTQTDPRRMNWFKQRLRELAQTIQILVLTCRPEDYLMDGERPNGQTRQDTGSLRAHDLERLIQREA